MKRPHGTKPPSHKPNPVFPGPGKNRGAPSLNSPLIQRWNTAPVHCIVILNVPLHCHPERSEGPASVFALAFLFVIPKGNLLPLLRLSLLFCLSFPLHCHPERSEGPASIFVLAFLSVIPEGNLLFHLHPLSTKGAAQSQPS